VTGLRGKKSCAVAPFRPAMIDDERSTANPDGRRRKAVPRQSPETEIELALRRRGSRLQSVLSSAWRSVPRS